MMNKLEVLSGKWSMVMEYTEDNGKSWSTSPESTVNVNYRLKKMMLAEIPEDITQPGFHLETYISFDQYRNVFRKAVIDDTWGIMDIYEGVIKDNIIVLTNLKSETFFPISSTVSRGFRITIELKNDKRMMIIEKTDDLGKTWQANFKTTYTKID